MKVVITGGTGFIGTNLMQYLDRTEPETEVHLIDLVPPCVRLGKNHQYHYADIRNLASLLPVFKNADEVYNLAGILGTSELNSIASAACETNVVGAANVLDACVIQGVKRVYNVAKPHFDGFSENMYTLTKHTGELLGLHYRRKYDLPVATVRWLNAVGPHQHLYPVRKFVPMMILLAMYGLPLEVYGSGNQTIDPIDTRDMARFTVHACRHLGNHPEIVDLGSGVAISCNDAALEILRQAELRGYTKSYLKHHPMREGEAPDVNLVAKTDYWDSVGMAPEYSFAQSVDATFEYIEHELSEEHRQNALQFYGIRL